MRRSLAVRYLGCYLGCYEGGARTRNSRAAIWAARKHENSHADCTKMRHRQAQYEDWQEGDKPNGAIREHRPLGKQDMHRRLQKELGEYQ